LSENKAKRKVMKTTKIITSILLVALATSAFGQLGSIKERLFPKKSAQVQFHTVDFNTGTGRIEGWLSDINNRMSDRNPESLYETPVVYRTIYARQAEVIFENEIGMEHWMAIPFENSLAEEEVTLEEWMADPFESATVEEEVQIESWMTTPFFETISEEEVKLESWMTIPFEAGSLEPAMELEAWMTIPFEAEEALRVEGWMIASIWK
jgi:hypothetical protein